MADTLDAPTLTVRDRTITGKFLSVREGRPLFARMRDPENDWLAWTGDIFAAMCSEEDCAFLLDVPLVEIGLENVAGFFTHGATGAKTKTTAAT